MRGSVPPCRAFDPLCPGHSCRHTYLYNPSRLHDRICGRVRSQIRGDVSVECPSPSGSTFVAVTPRSRTPPSDARWASRIRWVSHCGRLHWNSQRQSMPSKSRAPSSDISGPYTRTRWTCSAASRNGGSRPTESRISSVPGWIAVARLVVRTHLLLDEPRAHAVAGELGCGEQPGGTGADNQNVVSRHPITPGSQMVRI
jgi:hypothetical protein